MLIKLRPLVTVALLAFTPALVLAAANPWDGTWKIKPGSYKITGKPDSYLLNKGLYTCGSCNPKYTVKADGKDHAIAGSPYVDSVAVTIVNDRTIQLISAQNTKVVVQGRRTVSTDGKTMLSDFTNYMGAKEAHFSMTSQRVAPGPAGSHAISGEWRDAADTEISDTGRTAVIASTAKGMKMTWNGAVVDAEFGGPPVLQTNYPGNVMVALKKTGERTIEETDTIKGKVADVIRYELAADGKSITVVDEDKLHGQRIDYVMTK